MGRARLRIRTFLSALQQQQGPLPTSIAAMLAGLHGVPLQQCCSPATPVSVGLSLRRANYSCQAARALHSLSSRSGLVALAALDQASTPDGQAPTIDATTSPRLLVPRGKRGVTQAAEAGAPGVADTEDNAIGTQELWHGLLRVLHKQGDFGATVTPLFQLFADRTSVKDAVLSFARRRPDILFALPPSDLAALARVPLPARERPDRKLRSADARLKGTFASGSAPGFGSGTEGDGSVSGSPAAHATTQDLMRVLWEWAATYAEDGQAAAPGLESVLRRVLRAAREAAVSEPDPGSLERASRLALGTPTAAELEERAALAAAAAEEGGPVGGHRRREREAALEARRHRQQLRLALKYVPVLEAGDWVCGGCAGVNWADRRRCFRCDAPSGMRGNTVVTPEDVTEIYGDRPPRRRPRAAAASADADAMYEAQAAAAAVAADAAEAARAVAPAATRDGAAGGAAARTVGSGRRALRELMTEDEEPGPAGPRGAAAGARSRGGESQRGERYGRPGLRRRPAAEDGDDGAGGEEGAEPWDREDGPARSQSQAWQRNLEDFYSEPPAGGSHRAADRGSSARRDSDYGDDGEGDDRADGGEDRLDRRRRDRDRGRGRDFRRELGGDVRAGEDVDEQWGGERRRPRRLEASRSLGEDLSFEAWEASAGRSVKPVAAEAEAGAEAKAEPEEGPEASRRERDGGEEGAQDTRAGPRGRRDAWEAQAEGREARPAGRRFGRGGEGDGDFGGGDNEEEDELFVGRRGRGGRGDGERRGEEREREGRPGRGEWRGRRAEEGGEEEGDGERRWERREGGQRRGGGQPPAIGGRRLGGSRAD